MVRIYHIRKRFAFTLIELIFAIVIIGISVISLPMMMQVTSKGIEANILQEAIFAASTQLMSATGGYWDERSMEDRNISSFSRVVKITTNANDCNDTTKRRPGHINQPFHRVCLNSTSVTGLDSSSDDTIDSLDDEVASGDIFDGTTTDSSGYKDTYTSVLSISRNGDIKMLTSTVSNSNGVITILRTQSANIGEIDYYKRIF